MNNQNEPDDFDDYLNSKELDSLIYGESSIETEDDYKFIPPTSKSQSDLILEPGGFYFLTGQAGTGKTTLLKKLQEQGESILLTASTGVAAMNLNTITINAALGFFDTDSLRYKFQKGRLNSSLKEVLKQADYLALDECSMTAGEQIELITQAINDINNQKSTKKKLGLILSGDMAQLPAIKSKQPYEADCWNEIYEPNTVKLSKIWRQTDIKFIEFINAARSAESQKALDVFQSDLQGKFHQALDFNFEGTTILATNKEVDRVNFIRLSQLKGKPFALKSTKHGIRLKEWEKIADKEQFKIGAFVMILANKYTELEPGGSFLDREIIYSNGSTGWIEGYGRNSRGKEYIEIRLVDGDRLVQVEQITRHNKVSQDGAFYKNQEIKGDDGEDYTVTYDPEDEKLIIGHVVYYPLRLAYASSCHKSQGLSLDRVQVDISHSFFGSPSMVYVALSRARTMEGLRLVGSPDMFVKRCKIDEKIRRFL